MVMAGPRVYAAMADDRALPGVLGARSRRGVPWVAIVLQGAIAGCIVWWGDVGNVIKYVGFLLSIFAGLAVLALIILRFTRPEVTRPYRTPIVLPVIFVLSSGWIVYQQIDAGFGHVWWALGSVVAGLIVWTISHLVSARRRHADIRGGDGVPARPGRLRPRR
jgi:amino acid transporter